MIVLAARGANRPHRMLHVLYNSSTAVQYEYLCTKEPQKFSQLYTHRKKECPGTPLPGRLTTFAQQRTIGTVRYNSICGVLYYDSTRQKHAPPGHHTHRECCRPRRIKQPQKQSRKPTVFLVHSSSSSYLLSVKLR